LVDNDAFAAMLDGAREGADWAWRSLHQLVAASLRGYLGACGMPDPDDAVTQVLTRVARKLRSFDGSDVEFRVLVFHVAHELVHEQGAPQSGAAGHRTRDRGRSKVEPSGAVGGIPSHVLMVLGRLDPDARDSVLLAVFGGLDVDEIAQVLGIDGPAARALQKSALGTLQAGLF
jgi:DNA-directed RNA polymerase specialized sigma24 family protein